MIKNIIFDMGGVLLRFEPEQIIGRKQLSSTDVQLLRREVFGAKEWGQMDDGSLDETAFCSLLKTRLPQHLHDVMTEIVFHWEEPLMEYEGMTSLVQSLKEQGFGLYLLSNASRRQPEYWQRMSVSPYFDGTLVSAFVRQVKPNPDIYHTLFKTFALDPSECLFIDDREENIEAGYREGMAGIVFRGSSALLRQELEKVIQP